MVRALTQTVRGVGSSPTWHYSFPCVNFILKNNSFIISIRSLLCLPDIIDLDQLSTKSDITNYVNVQDVKLTRIHTVFNIMYLNVHSLTRKFDKLKQLNQYLHQKKSEVVVILHCEAFLHTEILKLVKIPKFSFYTIITGKIPHVDGFSCMLMIHFTTKSSKILMYFKGFL